MQPTKLQLKESLPNFSSVPYSMHAGTLMIFQGEEHVDLIFDSGPCKTIEIAAKSQLDITISTSNFNSACA
jgi:hypothetical protein